MLTTRVQMLIFFLRTEQIILGDLNDKQKAYFKKT
jgi:hypothetical protein